MIGKTITKLQDQSSIKYNNMSMVLEIIRTDSQVSRSKISKITGMSPTSSTRIVAELMKHNLVKESDLISVGVGRKAMELLINGSSAYFLGIEITDVYISLCITDFIGNIIGFVTKRNPSSRFEVDALIEELYTMHLQLLDTYKISHEKLKGIGIGIVGTVDSQNGIVIFSDLLKWEKISIKERVEARFLIPVFIDNDIKCSIVAEEFRYHKSNLSNASILSFGRGVGGATIYEGKMIRGELNSAGEIGHTIVDYSDGRVCYCGRRGCATAYLTEDRIIEDAQGYDETISSLDEFYTAFLKEETWAIRLFDKISMYIAILISNIVCYHSPNIIILRGSLFEQMPNLYGSVLQKYHANQYIPLRNTTQFFLSELREEAVCLGAALKAMENYSIKTLKEIAGI